METLFASLPFVLFRPVLTGVGLIAVTGASGPPAALTTVLNIVLAIAFLIGVMKMIESGAAVWRGDAADGKMGLISGVMIAGVSVVVKFVYESFALPTGF